ncbi:hypothetical protein HanIR_Chr11g0538671 [Helianthus annuus]|nr:hypothetical protein HanIR_Chr11g0538671 [Helianthus annuus]
MSDRSIGCCEPHPWACEWLHVVTMSFHRRGRYEIHVQGINWIWQVMHVSCVLNRDVIQGHRFGGCNSFLGGLHVLNPRFVNSLSSRLMDSF